MNFIYYLFIISLNFYIYLFNFYDYFIINVLKYVHNFKISMTYTMLDLDIKDFEINLCVSLLFYAK